MATRKGSVLLTVDTQDKADALAKYFKEEFVDIGPMLAPGSRTRKAQLNEVASGILHGRTKFAYLVKPKDENETGRDWWLTKHIQSIYPLYHQYDKVVVMSDKTLVFENRQIGTRCATLLKLAQQLCDVNAPDFYLEIC